MNLLVFQLNWTDLSPCPSGTEVTEGQRLESGPHDDGLVGHRPVGKLPKLPQAFL